MHRIGSNSRDFGVLALMHEKKEEQSIEEYWDLFRDTLPGAESSVEAIYRMLEVLSRQVDTFSEVNDREERYPQLFTTRDRNPSCWKLTLKFWSHTGEEELKIVATGKIYSSVVADLFGRIIKRLKDEASTRLMWVTQTEQELASLKDCYRKSEKFLSSLGTYNPEQQNLPLGVSDSRAVT